MAHIMINGEKLELLFTFEELKDMEKTIGTLEEVGERLQGDHGRGVQMETCFEVLALMINAARDEAGSEERVTPKWVGRRVRTNIRAMVETVVDVIAEGMHMDTQEEDDKNRHHDLVLEEIERKTQQAADLPAGRRLWTDSRVELH